MNEQVSKQNDGLTALIVASQARFAEVAPKWLNVDRMIHLAIAARSRQPALLECTSESVLAFCQRCAETGLEPIGAGGAWAVPFKNKTTGKLEMQFIPDWRGLIQLAKHSGQITHAYAEIVHEGDAIEYEKGDTPCLVHRPSLTQKGKVIGAYCVCVLPNGSKHIEYMTIAELDAIKSRSKASANGPWVTDVERMYCKTVVRRALGVFAASPQMQTALQLDNEATGLAVDLATARVAPRPLRKAAPVAIPQNEVEVGKPTSPPPPEVGDNKPPQEPPQQPPSGNTVTGIVEDIVIAEGVAKGQPWTRYGVIINGTKYGTFDKKVGEAAQALKGHTATATVEDNGKYHNLIAIEKVEL